MQSIDEPFTVDLVLLRKSVSLVTCNFERSYGNFKVIFKNAQNRPPSLSFWFCVNEII